MKKLYTLALAAAVALSAAAADVLQLSSAKLPTRQLVEVSSTKNAVKSGDITRVAKAPAKAAAAEDLFGEYDWEYFIPLEGGGDVAGKLYVSATEEPGFVAVEGITQFPVFAEVDYEKATLTFPIQILGQVNANVGGVSTPVDVYYFPGGVDKADNPIPVSDPTVATFDGKGIYLNENDGFIIAAVTPGLETVTEEDIYGYFNACYLNVITKYNESEFWTTLGEGYFVNGIFLSMYKFTDMQGNPVEEIEGEVTILRNIEDPNVLRIKNAFANIGGGNLDINIADPKNVKVPLQDTGFIDKNGNTFICSQSVARLEYVQNPITDEQFLAEFGEYAITITGDEITFPGNSIFFTWPYSDDEEIANGFFTSRNPQVATITLPEGWNTGIEDITVEEDGAVEYFNLQGIRVANPEAGLYIRRAGSKVEKIFVK